ncbi:hypothetical protein DIT68_10155 [Brumimicrobium oceani]|uniref:histidine kinase n=1 Tax=Brumimicrobium oceani TaxID=2100725 RepID=A0A2U2XBY1_9FLAO|nr:hypothetical protein DIT68_10155 [Brumimicrobium oceani]
MGVFSIAQTRFFENLDRILPKLSSKEKIDTIVAIPFEIMNSEGHESVAQYKLALTIAKEINDADRVGRVYEKMGLAYYYLGEYDTSVLAMTKAIEAYEKSGNQVRMGSTYASIGYQMKRRNLPTAFEYMREGIKILKPTQDETALSAAYNNIGVLHQFNDDLDSALYYFYLGYDLVLANKDSLGIPYSLNNIGQAFFAKGEFDKALNYYEKAFKIRSIKKDRNGIAENYRFLADVYFEQQEYDKAIENYLASMKIGEEINYTYLCQVNSDQLAISYEKIGDYKQALHYRNLNQTLKDKIINEQSNKAIAALEVQFDTERKEKELAIKSASVIQEKTKVRRRTSLLIGVLITLALLLFIALLIYRQLKAKQLHLQKENQLKDLIAETETKNKIYEERMRISRDLHDNIGSQLTFLISSMDNMKYISDGEKLKFKLTDLSSFARVTISQLRDTIWAMNKDKLSIEDMHIRILSFLEIAKENTKDIQFSFENTVEDKGFEFSPSEGINLFRILQESVNNAIKYASPEQVEISMKEERDAIVFTVVDDGIGFDELAVRKGFGLRNMQARAKEINARYELRSELGSGTHVIIEFPKNT